MRLLESNPRIHVCNHHDQIPNHRPKHLNDLVDELKSNGSLTSAGVLAWWFGQPAPASLLPDSVTADSLAKLLRGDFLLLPQNTNAKAATPNCWSFQTGNSMLIPRSNAFTLLPVLRAEFIDGEHIYVTWSCRSRFINNQELMQTNLNPTGKRHTNRRSVFPPPQPPISNQGLKTTRRPYYGICRDARQSCWIWKTRPSKAGILL